VYVKQDTRELACASHNDKAYWSTKKTTERRLESELASLPTPAFPELIINLHNSQFSEPHILE